MDSAELLRQALQAARSGRELTARDLFQDVVRLEPDNETAWIWLSGLLDPLEDRIMACERVLTINPGNQKVRAYRERLVKEKEAEHQQKLAEVDVRVHEARQLLNAGRQQEAYFLLQDILREEIGHKDAWELFAEISVNIEDKVRAYEAIVRIAPGDGEARERLKRFRFYQRNPLELAAYYEEEGELDKALDLYHILAAGADNSSEFDRIHRSVVRLEDLQIQNIRHIKPAHTILRLSLGLPLLYVFEILIQEGLNPIRHPAPDLWIGIPLVGLGSFLVTAAGIRSRHFIWQEWFGEQEGRGSSAVRRLAALLGWIMVFVPHLLLVWDSYLRMLSFRTPPIP